MIDAGRDFIKDGNKNRLRERDIFKIVSTYQNRVQDDPGYARFVPLSEIRDKNGCNLNIPRYIAGGAPEDEQDIEAHLQGGIPAADVDGLARWWTLFPGLKDKLFSAPRPGYYRLNVPKDEARAAIHADEGFGRHERRVEDAFAAWRGDVEARLRDIGPDVNLKSLVAELADRLVARFSDIELVDKFDVYEALLSYWGSVMADDVFLLKYDGYLAGREIELEVEAGEGKRGPRKKVKGWKGKLLPQAVVERAFFAAERARIEETRRVLEEAAARLEELAEEHSAEGGALADCLNDKDAVDAREVTAKLKRLKWTDPKGEETAVLSEYAALAKKAKDQAKLVKDLEAKLEAKTLAKYPELSEEAIKDLLVRDKWCAAVFEGIRTLYAAASHSLANRVAELAERYEEALPDIEREVAEYEAKVKGHLERMGFVW